MGKSWSMMATDSFKKEDYRVRTAQRRLLEIKGMLLRGNSYHMN